MLQIYGEFAQDILSFKTTWKGKNLSAHLKGL